MTLLASYLTANPRAFVAGAALLGLLIGSFLNVVIYRLPRMIEHAWRRQCQELLNKTDLEVQDNEPFNLINPRSRCPHCGQAISPLANIPVISFLCLRGRCACCGKGISLRYPATELVTAFLSGITAWHFGFGWGAAAALALTWALIALSLIDYDHQLLPDDITLPYLWAGLLLSLTGLFVDSAHSILGAAAGYLSLWSIYKVFRWITGKEGMGYGDFKLLAMLGAWMGWQSLPAIIVLSSAVGATLGIASVVFRGRDKNLPIPFGPYLATAGWLNLLWGDNMIRLYLSLTGQAG